MKQFVNWEYYSSLYSNVKEEDFERLEALAEKNVAQVVGIIHYAHIDEEEPGFEQLKDCICKVMNKLQENEKSSAGKGISSVSNDGYSETYVLQTEEQMQSDIRKSIKAWLSGTGIVRAY